MYQLSAFDALIQISSHSLGSKFMTDEKTAKSNIQTPPLFSAHAKAYRILGFEETPASMNIVRTKYRQLLISGEYRHPDKGGDKDKFQILQQAYDEIQHDKVSVDLEGKRDAHDDSSEILWDHLRDNNSEFGAIRRIFRDLVRYKDGHYFISGIEDANPPYTLSNIPKLFKQASLPGRLPLLKILCHAHIHHDNNPTDKSILIYSDPDKILDAIPEEEKLIAKELLYKALRPTGNIGRQTLWEMLPSDDQEKLYYFLVNVVGIDGDSVLQTIKKTLFDNLNKEFPLLLIKMIPPSHRLAFCEKVLGGYYLTEVLNEPQLIIDFFLQLDNSAEITSLRLLLDKYEFVNRYFYNNENPYNFEAFFKIAATRSVKERELLWSFWKDEDLARVVITYGCLGNFNAELRLLVNIEMENEFKKLLEKYIKKVGLPQEPNLDINFLYGYLYLYAGEVDSISILRGYNKETFRHDLKGLITVLPWNTASVDEIQNVLPHDLQYDFFLDLEFMARFLPKLNESGQHTFAFLFGKWRLKELEERMSEKLSETSRKELTEGLQTIKNCVNFLQQEEEKLTGPVWWKWSKRGFYYAIISIAATIAVWAFGFIMPAAHIVLFNIASIAISAISTAVIFIYVQTLIENSAWYNNAYIDNAKNLKKRVGILSFLLIAFSFTFLLLPIAISPITITGAMGMFVVGAGIAGICGFGLILGLKIFYQPPINCHQVYNLFQDQKKTIPSTTLGIAPSTQPQLLSISTAPAVLTASATSPATALSGSSASANADHNPVLTSSIATLSSNATVAVTAAALPTSSSANAISNSSSKGDRFSSTQSMLAVSLQETLLQFLEKWQLAQAMQQSLQTTSAIARTEDLKAEAKRWGFECTNVLGDGNCFFHAVEQQLKTQDAKAAHTHETLRQVVLQNILDHLDEYKSFNDRPVDEWIGNLAQNGTWADDLMVVALSRTLNMTIAIARSDRATPTIIRQKDAKGVLYLGYEVGVHYQSLTPLANNNLSEIKKLIEAAPFDQPTEATNNSARPKRHSA